MNTTRRLPENDQQTVRKLLENCQKRLKMLSENYQKMFDNDQKTFRKRSANYQKLSEKNQNIFRKLLEHCQKTIRDCQKQISQPTDQFLNTKRTKFGDLLAKSGGSSRFQPGIYIVIHEESESEVQHSQILRDSISIFDVCYFLTRSRG